VPPGVPLPPPSSPAAQPASGFVTAPVAAAGNISSRYLPDNASGVRTVGMTRVERANGVRVSSAGSPDPALGLESATGPGQPPCERRTGKQGLPAVRVVDSDVRVVRSRRITLNFTLKDVGPSGVSAVELWYTQDCKEWKMCEAPLKAPPYLVEVDEEGKYGFTLRARSGAGLGQKPPGPGDEPQVWVIVDQTKPVVQRLEVTPTMANRAHALGIRWQATDANFGRQPISLSYAEREEGPWQPIAANLPNTGHYVWQLPAQMPNQFLVRVEAVDLAGNTACAQTFAPVVLDSSTPSVSILAVEGGPK
jgi:hypothetical protein